MQKYLHEIIKEAEAKKNLTERKAYLSQHKDRKALRALLEISYNKDIETFIPETDPPYKESNMPEGMNHTRLDAELRRFDVFLVKGRYPNMNSAKRESIFLNILETLHPEEAKIFLKAFQHKFHIKGMRVEHINEVFGTKIPTPSTKKKEESTENATE